MFIGNTFVLLCFSLVCGVNRARDMKLQSIYLHIWSSGPTV